MKTTIPFRTRTTSMTRSHMTRSHMTRSHMTRTGLSALAVVTALSLSACGGDDGADADAGSSQGGAQDGGQQDGDRSGERGRDFPGAMGKVAAVSDGVAQVQGSDGQTAVAFADATITTTEAAQLSDLAVGQCVSVTFASSASNSTGDDEKSDADAQAGAAATVSISDPVDGECSPFGGGFGGGPGGPGGSAGQAGQGGQGGQGSGGERPELPEGVEPPGDMPSGAPSGAPDGQGGQAGQGGRPGQNRVSGKVTAVSATGFTVDAVSFSAPPSDGGDASASAAPETTPETSTESREVSVDGDTTYTRSVAGKTGDVTEGRCVTATGEQDDTGQLKATALTVQDAVDGECTGFGGGRR